VSITFDAAAQQFDVGLDVAYGPFENKKPLDRSSGFF
jgi:hypothetical protein